MGRLVTQVADDADATGRSLRASALDLTARNSAALTERFGIAG